MRCALKCTTNNQLICFQPLEEIYQIHIRLKRNVVHNFFFFFDFDLKFKSDDFTLQEMFVWNFCYGWIQCLHVYECENREKENK